MGQDGKKNGRSTTKSDLLAKIKDILPKDILPKDEELRRVIDDFEGDEDKVQAWLATQIDERSTWNQVETKGTKKAQATKQAKGAAPRDREFRDRPSNPRNGPRPVRGLPPHANSNAVTATFLIPKSKHIPLIGPRGESIRSIESEASVKIVVPDRASYTSLVTVTGEPSRVEVARKSIERLLGVQVSLETPLRFAMELPDQARAELSNKDRDWQNIEARFGCAIHVPRLSSTSSVVVLEGPGDRVHLLKSELSALLNFDQSLVNLVQLPEHDTLSKLAVSVRSQGNKLTKANLLEHLSQAGPVQELLLIKSDNDLKALASFKFSESAQKAVNELDASVLAGSELSIKYAGSLSSQLMPVLNSEAFGARVTTGFPAPKRAAPQQQQQGPPPQQQIQQQVPQQQQVAVPSSVQPALAQSSLPPNLLQQGLLPRPQQVAPPPAVRAIEEDPQAAKIAGDIIQSMTTTPNYDLHGELCSYPLPKANTIQLYIRQSLRDRMIAQSQKVNEARMKSADARRICDELAHKIQQRKHYQSELKEQLLQIQQKIAANDQELGALESDHQSNSQIMDLAEQHEALAAKNAALFQDALSKADHAAQQVSRHWTDFLLKLTKNNFDSWTENDLTTLLVCLGMPPETLQKAGIEPTMLDCIEDSVLRDIRINDRTLSFGDRRLLLIAIRGLISTTRVPALDPGHLPTRSELVCYLMQWGLKVQLPPNASKPPKHMLLWTLADVMNHFRSVGLEQCAETLERERVVGPVLLTLSRKDCFSLGMPTLGDTVHAWKETLKLQNEHTPSPTKSTWPEDAPAWRWSVNEVAKFFETRASPQLVQICLTQKISGDVLLCLERTDDLLGIEFAKPADRIKLLQLCKVALTEAN
eukprot:c11833_g1_i1.p1 GENE.c11833_g1_i1~~c11833_g1_i1.p1  ORF type:complete len:889 (+),score=210.24 c11833_g1_i1:47-2668(+)